MKHLLRRRLWLWSQTIDKADAGAQYLLYNGGWTVGQRLGGHAQLGECIARVGIATWAVAHHQEVIVDNGRHKTSSTPAKKTKKIIRWL